MTGAPRISRRALVVFVGATELKKLWLLKRGYRHCFVIIEGEAGWTLCNPLSHFTEIETYPSLNVEDIAGFYRGLGYAVVKARVQEPPKKVAPLSPYTCVEAVKRALGVQARGIVTPWQLYQYLEKNLKIENNSLTYHKQFG